MALVRVGSKPVDLHRFRPAFHALPQSPRLIKTSIRSQRRTRRFPTIFACQTTPNPPETEIAIGNAKPLLWSSMQTGVKDRVNFVMLNVDNTKWEQELDEFGAEGITHFPFLDRDGNEEGNVVGRLPKQYFLENMDALEKRLYPMLVLWGSIQVLKTGSCTKLSIPEVMGRC